MNPYYVLNVRENSSIVDINKEYKRLKEKYDLKNYQGDPHFAEKKMKEIEEAYSILSNSEKRKVYDKKHKEHIASHISSSDSFSSYYKTNITSEHIHEDFDIATKKYNKFKNHLLGIDDSLSDNDDDLSNTYDSLNDDFSNSYDTSDNNNFNNSYDSYNTSSDNNNLNNSYDSSYNNNNKIHKESGATEISNDISFLFLLFFILPIGIFILLFIFIIVFFTFF